MHGIHLCLSGKCDKCDSVLNSAIDPRSKNIDDIDVGWENLCEYLEDTSLHCPALSVATKSNIDNLILRNFPPTTRIEYLARLPEGQYLLVTRQEYDWEGDVIVHYGLPGELEPCVVISFMRSLSTLIRFMIGSVEAEAFFGIEWESTSSHQGKDWLQMHGDTISIERIVPQAQALKELGIECEHEIR